MNALSIICKLVRMSVFGNEEDILAGVDWKAVMIEAEMHGVSCICYEAVRMLPEELGPDQGLLAKWGQSVRKMRVDSRHRYGAMMVLNTLLEEHGIKMVLVDGGTTLDDVPAQDIRAGRDLHFSVSMNPGRCNVLLKEIGVKLTHYPDYTSFNWNGIHFRNCNLERMSEYSRSHRRIVSMMKMALFSPVRRQDGIYELEPVTRAVYLVDRMTERTYRMGGRIGLGALLTFAQLLKEYPYIQMLWDGRLHYAGLEKYAGIMLCAADELFRTSLHKEWSRWTRHRARRFIRQSLM